MEKKDVLEFLNAEGNKGFLQENGFQTIVEKEIEVPAVVNDEVVNKFIGDNQSFRDKIHNEITTEFLKKKTGVEKVTPEMLGENLVLESQMKGELSIYKKSLVEATLGVKNPELLMPQIKLEDIEFKDGKLEGLGSQLEALKTKYPDMFNAKDPGKKPTPPGGGGTPPTKLTYEEFQKMTQAEKATVPTDVINSFTKN